MCPDRMLIPRTKVIHHSLSGKCVSLTSQVSSSQAGRRCQPFSGDLLTHSHMKCFLHLTSQGTWRWKLKNRASQEPMGRAESSTFLHLGVIIFSLSFALQLSWGSTSNMGEAGDLLVSDPSLVLFPLLLPPQMLQELCRRAEKCWTISFQFREETVLPPGPVWSLCEATLSA